ncbi:MAG TPA: HNH endonuclease [Syntrophorhabdaceae bacterium]|nr:HNH endonuclease [Syntrophorhabdaceae bacterium]HNT69991.1 HNH endonuclease [Syntrophorhabdaceae bacterium]
MDRTLLLNTTFEPISVLSWKKAITLVFLGKVEVLREYEREIKGVSISIRQPAVIRLQRFVRNNHTQVKFSRRNIFIRDDYTCQYCGERFDSKGLTCDHITPRSRGGITEWTNIVTSCIRCNLKKGDKLPEEAGMHPRKRPSRPNGFYMLMLHLGVKAFPENWREYLFLRD